MCKQVAVYIFIGKQVFSAPWAVSELVAAMSEGIGEFQRQEEPGKVAAGEGAGKGAAAAAGDRSRRLQPELCKFLTRIPVWAGRSGKTLFFAQSRNCWTWFLLDYATIAMREEAKWNMGKELFSGGMQGHGNSQPGSYWGYDGVGKMQKEDDINRHGLYESEENNRGITMQKRWGQWTHASGEYSSDSHFSLLPDFFYQKNEDNPIGRSEGMGPKPYCSNNTDGCDKRKEKTKRERGKKMHKGTDLMKEEGRCHKSRGNVER